MNNSKLARIISTKRIAVNEDVRQVEIKICKTVINMVDIWSDPNITLSKTVTQFDMAVMDAAYTIMQSGSMVLTPERIIKVLSGNKRQKATKRKVEDVCKSIDKLRYIHIKIDAENEINSRRDTKGKVDQFIYESYLLPLEKFEARYSTNGKVVTAYKVLGVPALYKYAELLHQIVKVPADWLETQDYYSDTDEAIIIKRYVIKRVAQIVSSNKLCSNKISYEWQGQQGEARGLFEELGYKPDDSTYWRQTKKPMIHKVVKSTLKYLQAKRVIKAYQEYREDGTRNPASPVCGFEIYY